MTMPDERTRNILQTGAFLRELREDASLPAPIRREANRLLRHYPTVSELHLLAAIDTRLLGSFLLTKEFDPHWLDGYQYGPHRE